LLKNAPCLTGLLLASLFFAAACNGKSDDADSPTRLLVVGWDGATFDLVDPLVQAGKLPNLARLMEDGVSANLESTAIPISSAAWTTATTGKEPGETGIYSFLQPQPSSYDVKVVSAQDNQGIPIWRTLVARGHEVIVWGVPLTWPPEPVRGVMVSGMLSPLDAAWAHPSELTDELKGRGMLPDLGRWRSMQELSAGRIKEQLAIKEAALVEQLSKPTWSLALTVFKNLDVLAHQRYTPELDGDVAGLMVELDATLGRLIEAAGPDTNVVVMSDHGFSTYPMIVDIDSWLTEAGFGVRKPDAKLDGRNPAPLAEARVSQRAERLGRFDMSKTRAFATTAEGNFAAIRLNVVGREPEGCVPPEERDAVLGELEAALAAVEQPAGTKVVRRTWRGQDLYPGDQAERVVPDLIVEFEPKWRAIATGLRSPFSRARKPFPEHQRTGICVVAGPSIAQREGRADWKIRDITPMSFYLLNEMIPSDLAGDPHASLLKTPRDVQRVDADKDPSLRSTKDAFEGLPTPGESADVMSALKSMGYAE
jgi:predicted AlkP superfamily phosphohydrolase/phosphomutase